MSTPSDFDYAGPNAELVREVIDFAFSNRIVAVDALQLQVRDQFCIEDITKAVDMAGGPRSHWLDIRSSRVADLIQTSEWWSWRRGHEPELEKVFRLAKRPTRDARMYLHEHLRARIPSGPTGPDGTANYYREYAINEIACDLMNCCKNRAINGLTDNFWEHLFTCYQSGGWPCAFSKQRSTADRFFVWYQ